VISTVQKGLLIDTTAADNARPDPSRTPFSHPVNHQPSPTRPVHDEQQRPAYEGLFQEPAGTTPTAP
jgi:hypothetical protein